MNTLGNQGEGIAANYLSTHGFKIILRNHAEKFGEIDILAKDKDKTLVFVEVKTLRKGDLNPEDNFTFRKSEKMKRIAHFFTNVHPELIDQKMGWRIDLIGITIDGEQHTLNHYKNVG